VCVYLNTAYTGDDPMTVADIRAQQLIVGALERVWPHLQIVGEEDCTTPPTDISLRLDLVGEASVPQSLRAVPNDEVVVFIDPLDATKEFTLGRVEAVITLVGIAVRGEPVAGVMYQPFVEQGRTMYGLCAGELLVGVERSPKQRTRSTGEGGEADGGKPREKKKQRVEVEVEVEVEEKLVVVSSRSHPSVQLSALLTRLSADRNLSVGGCGHKVLKVMEGEAHVYVGTGGTKKWDTCAPAALLRCVGGRLTDVAGNPLRYFYKEEVPYEYLCVCVCVVCVDGTCASD
jgi:3'(2'), 5'-bisphosphate nucleotidase